MIDSFKEQYRFLSNFYDAPILFDGRRYRNSEGAYQAAKFVEDKQMDISPWQFEELSGSEAKKLARSKASFIRSDWKEVCLGVMIEVVHAKFTQNYDLRRLLVATHPQGLVEGNTRHDYFYGVCSGKGENWLGRILMAERAYWLEIAKNDYCEVLVYKTDGISKEMFSEYLSGMLTVKPDNVGVGYVDPAKMLPFVRKVRGELDATTGLDSGNLDASISTIIGTMQAVNFLKDYGGVVSGPLLAKGFAEAWGIGVALGILIEQERQSQIAGTDELTKMLNWKAELASEFEVGRHLAIKL